MSGKILGRREGGESRGMAHAAVSAISWAWNGPKAGWESKSLLGRVRTRAWVGGRYQNLLRILGRLLVDRE